MERSLKIGSVRTSPYAAVEAYYVSKFQKWSSTEISAGMVFPIRKHVELTPYYEHENNTGQQPNQQVNGLGLILNLYL
jgi:hypothetical protein